MYSRKGLQRIWQSRDEWGGRDIMMRVPEATKQGYCEILRGGVRGFGTAQFKDSERTENDG